MMLMSKTKRKLVDGNDNNLGDADVRFVFTKLVAAGQGDQLFPSSDDDDDDSDASRTAQRKLRAPWTG